MSRHFTDFDPAEMVGDRRRNKRIEVGAPVRCALADGSEHDCILADIAVESVALKTSLKIALGERVRVELAEIGLVEGRVVRVAPDLMVLAMEMGAAKRGRLARRIETLDALEPRTSVSPYARLASRASDEDLRQLRGNLEAVVVNLVRNSIRTPRQA